MSWLCWLWAWLQSPWIDSAKKPPPALLPPPTSLIIPVEVGAMGWAEVVWRPAESALWVGLVVSTDQREGERLPPAPEIAGIELDGVELLAPGGIVHGIPAAVGLGCRVVVTVQSVCRWSLLVNVNFLTRPR